MSEWVSACVNIRVGWRQPNSLMPGASVNQSFVSLKIFGFDIIGENASWI